MQCFTERLKAAVIRKISHHNFDFINNNSVTEIHVHIKENPLKIRIDNLWL